MDPILLFSINNQIIVREKPFFEVVSDSKNYLYAKFNFQTPEWAAIYKTAIFEAQGNKYTAILEDDICKVPWEWLECPGINYVSVFGGDLITTNSAPVRVAKSDYGEGETTKESTPNAYNQVLMKLDNKADGVAIVGDTIQLYSGEDIIYENQFLVDGGTFTDWRNT